LESSLLFPHQGVRDENEPGNGKSSFTLKVPCDMGPKDFHLKVFGAHFYLVNIFYLNSSFLVLFFKD